MDELGRLSNLQELYIMEQVSKSQKFMLRKMGINFPALEEAMKEKEVNNGNKIKRTN